VINLQHIVLALKLLVAYAIPDIPQQVAEEKARLEFLRREALKVNVTKTILNQFSSRNNAPFCSRV
jgi:hypothetical protein